MSLENVEDIYPLTPLQQGMLFHCIASPDSDVYVSQISYELNGTLDPEIFAQAWANVVDRHTALRTVFVWDGVDEPLQVVRESVDITLDEGDYSALAEDARESAITERQFADRETRFDLTQAPLMRLSLLRLNKNTHCLIWTIHHLIFDGWSVATIVNEVMESYAAAISGTRVDLPPARPYRDYVGWLTDNGGTQADFWENYLAGFTESTNVPVMREGYERSERHGHAMIERVLNAETTDRIVQTARELRATLSTLVHAAWGILLSQYCDSADVVFGSTHAGRPTEINGIDEMVGALLNTVPVRLNIGGRATLANFIETLQKNLLEIRRHQYASLAEIQRSGNLGPGENLFESIVVFVNYSAPDREAGQHATVHIKKIAHTEHSNYPLAFLVEPGERLTLYLVYDKCDYTDAAANRLLDHAAEILCRIPDGMNKSPMDLSVLSRDERIRIIEKFNRTKVDLGRTKTVTTLIDEKMQINPSAIAIVCGDSTLNYGELDAAAGRCAAYLQSNGVGRGCIVAVCLERSTDLVSAIVGILKSGAAYLPLDPDYPPERLRYMLEDASPACLVTSAALQSLFDEQDVPITDIVEMLSSTEVLCQAEPLPSPAADDPAYVIYTSGSTGKPKGVVATHGNLAHSTLARHQYYPEPPGVFLMLSPFAFDSSIAGLFSTLTAGGTLVVSERRLEQDLQRFAACIRDNRVSHILCLPSLFQVLLTHPNTSDLRSLRTVILAGEACPGGEFLEQFRKLLPGATLYNEYGPTEASVWCTVFDTSNHEPSRKVPIGRPVANTKIYILDRAQRPVPLGVPGEIYVGGAGVTQGYLNNPAATATQFLCDPFSEDATARIYKTGDLGCYRKDGCIEFLGRRDHQIKILGHRIELGEIEAELIHHPDIDEAVVVAEELVAGARADPVMNEPEDLIRALDLMSAEVADSLLSEIEKLAAAAPQEENVG